jgi:hypothetical protein
MANKPTIYLDACCFIDVVKHSVGILPADRNDDVWHIKKLLEAHRDEHVRVMTSMLTLAECLGTEAGQKDVPEEVQTEFRLLLSNGQYLQLAQITPKTVRECQNLRWEKKIVLKGADGVHIATALEGGAVEFISTDERLSKPKMQAAARALGSAVKFIRASETAYLPDQYRQGQMNVG